jgi:hypothetical protein
VTAAPTAQGIVVAVVGVAVAVRGRVQVFVHLGFDCALGLASSSPAAVVVRRPRQFFLFKRRHGFRSASPL